MRRRAPSPAGPPTTTARTAALLLLGRREYTARELREKLIARGHDPADADRAVAELRADGSVNEERLAAAFIRTAVAVHRRGRHRIARELEARGIARPLIDRLLADLAPDDESAAIAEVLRRRRWPADPSLADRRRMFQHLLRRGFSTDAIGTALKTRREDL